MRFLVISASRNISQAQEFNSTTLIVSIKKEHTHYWYRYYYYASIDSEMVILLLKFLSLKKITLHEFKKFTQTAMAQMNFCKINCN